MSVLPMSSNGDVQRSLQICQPLPLKLSLSLSLSPSLNPSLSMHDPMLSLSPSLSLHELGHASKPKSLV